MKCQQGYAPTGLPIVLMEDPIIHTDTHPFCRDDPTCPCHRDIELLAAVTEAVAQGRLTQEGSRAGDRGYTRSLSVTWTAWLVPMPPLPATLYALFMHTPNTAKGRPL